MQSYLKYIIIFIMIVALLILPMVSGDKIMPGYYSMDVNNHLTNLNDFPDYIFMSSGEIGTGMCPLEVINEEGIINSYYKFCNVFVYAIPKDKFDLNKINEINTNESLQGIEVEKYLESLGGKKVLEGVETYKQFSKISTIREINRYYSIDLQKVKTEPDNEDIIRNKLIYFYIIIPLIALLSILFIIFKRKNADNN